MVLYTNDRKFEYNLVTRDKCEILMDEPLNFLITTTDADF